MIFAELRCFTDLPERRLLYSIAQSKGSALLHQLKHRSKGREFALALGTNQDTNGPCITQAQRLSSTTARRVVNYQQCVGKLERERQNFDLTFLQTNRKSIYPERSARLISTELSTTTA